MTGTEPYRAAPSLAQIVAALSVTYMPEGVRIWLGDHRDALDAGDLGAVADAVRRIGDADPDQFRVTEAN